ncbi:MAG: inorganic phosphate transporter [Candidatus Binatia bacterium]
MAAEFVNGWTDAPIAIATVVVTRVLSPHQALFMATCFNVLGTMSGTAVAATIGTGIIDSTIINTNTVAAAMVGIVVWSLFAYYAGGYSNQRELRPGGGISGGGAGHCRTFSDPVGRMVEGPDRALLFHLPRVPWGPGNHGFALSRFLV